MDDCVFCKIIDGKLSSDKVYEDNFILAFLTKEPVDHGHLLIIPKEHIVWMQDASDKTISDIFIVAKKLMKALKKVSGADYIQVTISGEEIAHFHVHLFPRNYKDGLLKFPHKKYKDGEASETAKKITAAL